MRVTRVDHQLIEDLALFIRRLNDESNNNALVIVEGQRDARALVSIGFKGDPVMLCHNESLVDLATQMEKYKKAILLLDLDRKGRALTKKAALILQEKKNVIDLHFRRELARITKGRIRNVEGLSRFEEYLQNPIAQPDEID